jgi:hypothetical protein
MLTFPVDPASPAGRAILAGNAFVRFKWAANRSAAMNSARVNNTLNVFMPLHSPFLNSMKSDGSLISCRCPADILVAFNVRFPPRKVLVPILNLTILGLLLNP